MARNLLVCSCTISHLGKKTVSMRKTSLLRYSSTSSARFSTGNDGSKKMAKIIENKTDISIEKQNERNSYVKKWCDTVLGEQQGVCNYFPDVDWDRYDEDELNVLKYKINLLLFGSAYQLQDEEESQEKKPEAENESIKNEIQEREILVNECCGTEVKEGKRQLIKDNENETDIPNKTNVLLFGSEDQLREEEEDQSIKNEEREGTILVNEICDSIVKDGKRQLINDSENETHTPNKKSVYMVYIFVFWKDTKGDIGCWPIFRVPNNDTGKTASFIDTSKRVYSDWKDFLENNKSLACKYYYSRDSKYYLLNDSVAFHFGISPAGRTFTEVLNLRTSAAISTIDMNNSLQQLIEEHGEQQLTKLDVVQFSSSLLLFWDATVNFKHARIIIENTKNDCINDLKNGIRSNRPRKAYNKLVRYTLKDHGNPYGKALVIKSIRKTHNDVDLYVGMGKTDKQFHYIKNKAVYADNGEIKIDGKTTVDPRQLCNVIKNKMVNFLCAAQKYAKDKISDAKFKSISDVLFKNISNLPKLNVMPAGETSNNPFKNPNLMKNFSHLTALLSAAQQIELSYVLEYFPEQYQKIILQLSYVLFTQLNGEYIDITYLVCDCVKYLLLLVFDGQKKYVLEILQDWINTFPAEEMNSTKFCLVLLKGFLWQSDTLFFILQSVKLFYCVLLDSSPLLHNEGQTNYFESVSVTRILLNGEYKDIDHLVSDYVKYLLLLVFEGHKKYVLEILQDRINTFPAVEMDAKKLCFVLEEFLWHSKIMFCILQNVKLFYCILLDSTPLFHNERQTNYFELVSVACILLKTEKLQWDKISECTDKVFHAIDFKKVSSLLAIARELCLNIEKAVINMQQRSNENRKTVDCDDKDDDIDSSMNYQTDNNYRRYFLKAKNLQ